MFPVQFLTADNVLHDRGGLEAGERVIIHAAAGDVGSAAVQVAHDAIQNRETTGRSCWDPNRPRFLLADRCYFVPSTIEDAERFAATVFEPEQ